jgi:5'-nucleotidase
MTLTGAQLKSVLEQQWQPAGASRPILHLGASKGFEWTYDPTAAAGSHITSITLKGKPIDPERSYSVVVNSFLASGGDNFTTFAQGTKPTDTGVADLQAMVDYLDEFASETPLRVDARQHAVGATFPAGSPATYAPGDALSVQLSSLVMAQTKDVAGLVDDEVEVSIGGQSLGTFPVDAATSADPDDETGKATVTGTVPTYTGTPAGMVVRGTTTGTEVLVPLALEAGPTPVVKASRTPRGPLKAGSKKLKVSIVVKVDGEPASGEVTLSGAGVDKTVQLDDRGRATTRVGPFTRGTQVITVAYGDTSDTLRFKVR